jgi:diacylglycerol kinase family enzyme
VRAFTALINPIAGGGRATRHWAPVAARLATAGADVRVELTRSGEHARQEAQAAAGAGRVVIAVGGDGLVRDVAGGVVPGGGLMGIVPAGRGNDLALALRLPADPDSLAELLLGAEPRTIDAIEADRGTPGSQGTAAGGVIVPGNVYAGIDSVASEIINASRWLPALVAYRLAPVRAIAGWHPPVFTLTLDGVTSTLRAHTVVVANSGRYGHGLHIVPPALVDDGLLHVMTVGAGPRRAVISFLRQAGHGGHVHRPEVEIRTGREVTIAADRPLPVGADGDGLGRLPITVRIRPGALRLIAPPPEAHAT